MGGVIPHNHKQFSDTAMCPRIHSIVTLSTRREHQTLQGKSLVLPDFLPLPTPQHTHTHFRYQSQAHVVAYPDQQTTDQSFQQPSASSMISFLENLIELRETLT